jgi:plasmid stabilization system protein ParE
MPQIKYSPRAFRDIERLKNFLVETAPEKVDDAIDTIFGKIDILESIPLAGVAVPCEEIPTLRKLIIPYGKNGYVALYKHDAEAEEIIIETIRHMRELEPEFLRTQ